MMDFDSPGLMLSGMLIGTIGFGMFLYGKKAEDLRVLFTGVALSVVPFVAHTMLILWGASAACCAGLWAWNRYGD